LPIIVTTIIPAIKQFIEVSSGMNVDLSESAYDPPITARMNNA
jgi:hypothetical protein